MKRKLINLFLTSALCLNGSAAFSQAYDWIIPPATRINFSSGTASVSSLPGTSAIAGCGPGATYNFLKYTQVVSDASGNGMTFVNNCGTYDLSGTSIAAATYQNVFLIPGLCKKYYAVAWEGVWGPPHGNKLTFRQLDASNPAAISEISSQDIINDGYMHQGISIAVAPLASDGTRRVYFSDDYAIKYVTVGATGTISGITTLTTLSTLVDPREGMEMSPDGTKIIVGTYPNPLLYNITTPGFTTLGSFTGTTVSGFEYVPYSGSDRIYISHHNPYGTYDRLSYISLSAPSVVVDALPSLPITLNPAGFGFTDVELARDGRLYFVYHPNYGSHYVLSGNSGSLYALNPTTGTLSTVMNGGTQVGVSTVESDWRYVVQRQVDGEKTLYVNSATTSAASFNINGTSQPNNTTVPGIYLCNDSLKLNVTLPGSHYQYDVMVEVGSVSSTVIGSTTYYTFNPAFPQPSGNSAIIPTTATSVTLNLLTKFPWLATYSGPLQVTVNNYGPCQVANKVQFFNLIEPTDFLMIGPNDVSPYNPSNTGFGVCSSSIVYNPVTGAVTRPSIAYAQDRNIPGVGKLYPSFAAVGTGNICNPAVPPPCKIGWLGASSVGISSGNQNLPPGSLGSISNYKILVEEFSQPNGNDSPLVFVKTVLNRTLTTNLTSGGIPPTIGYSFNPRTTPINYFVNNYDVIKNNYVYKVTYSATSSTCGVVSSYSYFKILSDGLTADPDGGINWRQAPGENATQFAVYPNPATTELKVSWNGETQNTAEMVVTDMMGRTLLQKTVEGTTGQNIAVLDIAHLAPGIYHLSGKTGNGKQYRINFVKQ